MNNAQTVQRFKGIKTTPAVPLVTGPHSHHWLIDTPCGPTSEGVCRVCGLTRTFRNSQPELDNVGFRDGYFSARRIQADALGNLGFHITDGTEDTDVG